MFKKITKLFFPILAIILVGIVFSDYYKDFSASLAQKTDADLLSVHFLDVGQGDSIYIRTPEKQDILIDAGPDAKVVEQLGKAMPFFDNEIEMAILTHPHADHVAGFIEVLKRYKVDKIYYTGVAHTSNVYLEFLNLVKEQKIPLIIVGAGVDIEIAAAAKFKILSPAQNLVGQKVEDLNDSSIVSQLIFGKTKFLFTGDVGADIENLLLLQKIDLSADILKIGHHGSKLASSEKFLQAVNPRFAIITCAKNNDFNFPHPKILSRLERLGIEIFRTDLNSSIVATSDGANVWVESKQ
ncbi:MBL fold metallo-hydrolase [Candidatus Falkowbacteria bacterium]|nr:MBL fold metallo-hydrolase [Candidatus Falkowbacteria bacterium]